MCPRSKTIPSVLIHSFAKQIVPSLYQESLTSASKQCVLLVPLVWLINHFLTLKTFLRMHSFFLVSFFLHFHPTSFRGLAGAYLNPGRFSLLVHSLVCPITHSSLDGFQPNLVQHFSHVCSTCHTIFSLQKTLECVYERLLHCRLIFAITWTPDK